MTTDTNAATGPINTTPPAETSIYPMNHDTNPTDNARPETAPIADSAPFSPVPDEVARRFAERVLAVISIDGEGGGTATLEEAKALMNEAADLFKPFADQPVCWKSMDMFFMSIIQRLYELTFRIKACEATNLALCNALRNGNPSAIVKALNRMASSTEAGNEIRERQADAAESTYNATECWGEAQSLAQAAAAGLLNEDGKERLRRLLDL